MPEDRLLDKTAEQLNRNYPSPLEAGSPSDPAIYDVLEKIYRRKDGKKIAIIVEEERKSSLEGGY